MTSRATNYLFASANLPRSVFFNRDSLFLVTISRRIAEYKVRSGVSPQRLFQYRMRQTAIKSSDPTKILARSELAAVLADLKHKAPRSKNTRLNLVIFRLACCCGLRASEIAQLQVDEVRVDQARPHLKIRRGAAKGGKARVVPLWWDAGTLEDIAAWKKARLEGGAGEDRPFLTSLKSGRETITFSRHTLRKRFRTACKVLGRERLQSLTIHHGRHTFISHALAGGRTLAEVRDAAGHATVTVTSGYLHVVADAVSIGRLFS